jgi:hypothetical protein
MSSTHKYLHSSRTESLRSSRALSAGGAVENTDASTLLVVMKTTLNQHQHAAKHHMLLEGSMNRDGDGRLIVPNKTNLKALKVRVVKEEACEELKLLASPTPGSQQKYPQADYFDSLCSSGAGHFFPPSSHCRWGEMDKERKTARCIQRVCLPKKSGSKKRK